MKLYHRLFALAGAEGINYGIRHLTSEQMLGLWFLSVMVAFQILLILTVIAICEER